MSKIVRAEDFVPSQHFSGLIYGPPGIGKTTFGISASKPLLIDCEKGMKCVESHLAVDSVQVNSINDIMTVLKEDLSDYDTIIFDTIGKFLEFLMLDIAASNSSSNKMLQSDGTYTLKAYGVLGLRFKRLISYVYSLNKSLIFIAHETERTDNEITVKRPALVGQQAMCLLHDLDFVGYMEVRGKKRIITFEPYNVAYTKNSIGLDGVIEVPNTTINGNTYIKDVMIPAFNERRQGQKQQRQRHNELLSNIGLMVSESNDLNITMADIKELDGITNNLLFEAKSLLDARAEVLGVKFCEEEKVYK